MFFTDLTFDHINDFEFHELFCTKPIDEVSVNRISTNDRDTGHSLLLERRNIYYPKIQRANNVSVLVCHDMAGGYHSDKYHYGSTYILPYQLMHMHLVDAFCYFSHHVISIPPLSWRSLCRNSNTSIYGTFLTEWEKGEAVCQALFGTVASTVAVAEYLIRLSVQYGLDGWLINIENKLSTAEIANIHTLLDYLRKSAAKLDVIWYDAVTCTGELAWQNEVNAKNGSYVMSAGAALLNYCWSTSHIDNTLTASSSVQMRNIYFGIDVFGRGAPGGYDIKTDRIDALTMATQQISCDYPSIALFAPGWMLEHELQTEMKQVTSASAFDISSWLHLQREIETKSEIFWKQFSNYAADSTIPVTDAFTSFYTFQFSAAAGLGVVYYNGRAYPHYYGRYSATASDGAAAYYDLSLQNLNWDVSLLNSSESSISLHYTAAWRGASCLAIANATSVELVPPHIMPNIILSCDSTCNIRVRVVLGRDMTIGNYAHPTILLQCDVSGHVLPHCIYLCPTSTATTSSYNAFITPTAIVTTMMNNVEWSEFIYLVSAADMLASSTAVVRATSISILCSSSDVVYVGEIGIESLPFTVDASTTTIAMSGILSSLAVSHCFYCSDLRRWSVICTWNSNCLVGISGCSLFLWKEEKAIKALVLSLLDNFSNNGSDGLMWMSCIPDSSCKCNQYELLLLTRAEGARLVLKVEDFISINAATSVCVVSLVPQFVSFSDVCIEECPTMVFVANGNAGPSMPSMI